MPEYRNTRTGVVVDIPGAPHKFVLGIAGPAFRFKQKLLDQELGPRLLEVKRQIEREMAPQTATA